MNEKLRVGLGMFLIFGALFYGVFFFSSYTGFVVKEIVEIPVKEDFEEALVKISLNQSVWNFNASDLIEGDNIVIDLVSLDINNTGTLYIDVLVNGTVVESKKVIIEQEIEEEPVIDEINKTTGGLVPEANESIEEINETIEEIVEEINETVEEVLNETIEITNETFPQNITPVINETIVMENASVVEEIEEVIQPVVVINKPVKWVKKVKLDNYSAELVVEIPKEASNINVKEIEDEKIKVKEEGIIKDLEDINELTGEAVKEIQTKPYLRIFFISAYDFIGSLFKKPTITGLAVAEEEETKEIIIEGPIKEVEIEYELPGPSVVEKEKINGKTITIFSEIHYENVLAYTSIEETDQEGINLYWIQNGKRNLVEDVTYLDENKNGLIDVIQWIVPSLSNQTYEVDLIILNVQSYPTVRGNWTIGFNTTGVANLTITAFNGTTWSNYSENGSFYDLRFLEVLCQKEGVNESVITSWQGNNCSQSGSCSVFIEDYSCNETSYETSKVLTEGDHYLRFQFGGITRYAKNLAGEYGGLAGGTNGTINLVTGAFGFTGSNETSGGYTVHTHGLLGLGKNVTSGLYTLGLGYIYMLDIVMSVFIDLISPIDNEILNSVPSFTYYPSADEIHSCKLYGNWTANWHLNQTDYGVTAYSNNQFSLSELEQGLFIWSIECNNSQGSFFAENNYTFRFNLPPNKPDLNEPLNNTYWRGSVIEFNWSNSSDGTGDSIYYYLEIDDSIGFDSVDYANTKIAETANVTSASASGLTTGDYWWRVLAYDDYGNSSWSEVRNLTINLNQIPTAPQLFLPTNDTYMTNRTPIFSWSNSSDIDGDTITYNIQVDGDIGFSSPEVDGFDVSSIEETPDTTNWTATAELQEVDTEYFWRVRAYDGFEYGSWSEIRNFTIVGIVALDLVVDEIDFGILGPGKTDNTTDNSPGPIVMRNSGNVGIDINISLADSSASLWSSDPSPTSNYQYKIDNKTNEEGAFNWVGSITSWTNVDVANTSYKIENLNYSDDTDEAELDILITVPGDEPGGEKTSDLTITGVITGG